MKRSELKQLIQKVIEEQAGNNITKGQLQSDYDTIIGMMMNYENANIEGFNETGDSIYGLLQTVADEMQDFIIEGSEDNYVEESNTPWITKKVSLSKFTTKILPKIENHNNFDVSRDRLKDYVIATNDDEGFTIARYDPKKEQLSYDRTEDILISLFE